MSQIDPVEALLAVIGVRPIISKEVEKVTIAQAREAQNLEKEIYKEAKAVVNGEKYRVPLGSVNYKQMLNDLTEPYNEGQLLAMVEKFPVELHALTAQFVVKAQQVVEILRKLIPIQTKQTLLGPENIMPPALAVRRFATSLDVVDNPRRVLSHIACGSLLKSQVLIVNEIYPTLSKCITDGLTEAAINEKAKLKSFKLPTLVEIGSGTWLGVPRVSPKLQNQLQQNFADAQKAKDEASNSPSSQASGGQNSVIAKQSMTQNQRANFPQTQKTG